MANPLPSSIHAPPRANRMETLVAVLTAALVLGAPLFYSSPGYRRMGLLLGAGVVVAAMWRRLPDLLPARTPALGWVLAGLFIAHFSSLAGALHEGESFASAAASAGWALAGVCGVALLCGFWLRERWRPVAGRILVGLLVFLLVASVAGYFTQIEKWIPLGGHPKYFDPLRIALIWPTRLLTGGSGQLAWEHTNIAGFFFALGFVLIAERMAVTPGRSGAGRWLFAGACVAVVFLTGSRSAWLMIALALPLVLIGRPRGFVLRMSALVAAAVMVGFGGLQTKVAMLEADVKKAEAAGQAGPKVHHVSGLVTRGSSGRLSGYAVLWDELEGRRWFGRGVAATNKPVAHLMHEHSIYIATLRGGGLVALGGHLLLLGAAAWTAARLFRRGLRWPAVLLAAVLGGLLFDRVSVFRLTGHHEFVFHWAAVFIPLLLARGRRR